MSNITIYHNPACGTSRNTLEMLHNGGVLSFAQYASVMISVDAAAIAATLIMLYLFFRRVIPATY